MWLKFCADDSSHEADARMEWKLRVIQFSSVPWLIGLSGRHEGQLSRDPLPDISAGGWCKQFWHGRGCPLFDVVYPAFPLPKPWHHPPSKVPWRMVLERLSWRVLCPNHASFHFLTVARCSCGPTRKLVSLCTQSLVLCSKQEIQRLLRHLVLIAWILFSESASRFHVLQP